MSTTNGDTEMTEAATAAGAEVNGATQEFVHEKQRLRLVWLTFHTMTLKASLLTFSKLPGATDSAASFAFEKEDHTLGNALRYIIMKK